MTNAHDDISECAEQFMHFAGFDGFIPIHLKQIMRQNDPNQEDFRNLLEEVSKMTNGGQLSEAYQRMLRSRFHEEDISDEQSIFLALQHSFPEPHFKNGMLITYTNDRANIFNSFALSKIVSQNNQKISLFSIVTVSPDKSYRGNENNNREQRLMNQRIIYRTRQANEHELHVYLNSLNRRETKCTVPYVFHSAIGARVMLMRNIDIKKKLINGARGTIVGYVSNENEDLSQIFAIKIKFDFQEFNEPSIDVTRKIVNIYQMMNGECFTIYQFPLRLAWAVTAHKAQGQTLDKVSIDIGCQAFAHGAFYVALSRVRKLEDVLFFGSRRWPENGITFHINDYIQQQTRAIIDEAEHVFARNAPNADGNGHNEEEDFLINELSDEDMLDDDSIEDEENMTYNSIN